MKILVADDSKTTLQLIIQSLTKLGHEVMPANNGIEAIEIFKQERPDLIILDVVMEGLDGFECARRLRAINPEDWIPIIFLSGTVDDENISKGINAGGDDYLTKPYSEITLAAKIKAMQRISDMRQKLFDLTKKLAALSTTDALTGINNRLQFDRTIREKMSYANRHEVIMALLFIDLDNFKTINDNLGHYVGDLLLKETANRLRYCLRLEDFIARIGGDEFAILLEVEKIETAGDIARKIINTLAPSYYLAGNEVHISCSIGIACYVPQEKMTLESWIQNADIAMYHAKESGRNNYQYFSKELNKKHTLQVNLEAALRLAIEKKELIVQYQPIYNLKSHEIIKIEALVFWNHPQMKHIPASFFIPLAEELGIINQITKWTLKKIYEQGQKWAGLGFNYKIATSLSPKQLLQKNLIQFLTEMCEDLGSPTDILEIELTENSPLIYSESCIKILNNLHDKGINIILDNFGSGYFNLSNINHFPINALKVDRVFLKNVTEKINDASLIKAVITLGHNLVLDVIINGIEKEEQLNFVLAQGALFGQGDFLQTAKGAEEITKLLTEQKFLLSTK